MRTLCLSLSLLIGLSLSSNAQRNLRTIRVDEPITVDGNLEEAIWQDAEVASGFTNWQPEAGTTPTRKTEVKIVYDDNAIYVGAFMEAQSKAEIQTELTERDDIGNTDWVGVVLDTYGNGTNGFEFIVGATGVQFDAMMGSNGEDPNWSEVWYSEVQLTEEGWYCEMKIPYMAIRFPNEPEQHWRVNFMRRIGYTAEKCSFQYIDPAVPGFLNQSAQLNGVSDIKAPVRLSLSPYLTTYMLSTNNPGDPSQNSTSYSYNGGMDLKYGINEAFTLDMTLVPDFGQVQSDDRVLNLTPFEVRFSENRAFFTEGTELFDRAGLFYSRRVGGSPIGQYSVYGQMSDQDSLISNPGETQLYNAAKVSGRTKSGLGVGVFNAISGSTKATYFNHEDQQEHAYETAPLTNYNVLVLDQNLANNSYVSLINTNVTRKGSSYYDANVTGTEFDIYSKGQKWNVDGSAAVSQLIYSGRDNINGFQYDLSAGKSSGNFNFSVGMDGTSPSFDKNDLGFLTRTNVKGYYYSMNLQVPTGLWKLARVNFWFNSNLQTTFDENQFSSLHFNAGFWGQTKGTWNWNMWTNYRGSSNDFFEPRQAGKFLKRPGFYNMGWWIGSDNRKALQVGMNVFALKHFDEGMHYKEIGIYPRYRFSDKFSLRSSISINDDNNQLGWVTFEGDESIMGKRDITTLINSVSAVYTFNSKMSMNVRARHYWSKVSYNQFFMLAEEGALENTAYNEFNDFSVSLFNIDLNYIWRFAPGSDLIFNWKNAITGGANDEAIDFSRRRYSDGIEALSNSPSTNSVSIRLIYFLNGQNLL